jgi:drug/metabolite transporter (DMT)-like permease
MSKSKQTSAPLGAGLVVASSFVYASYGIWTKEIDSYFPEFILAVFRSLLVVLLFLPLAIYKKQLSKVFLKRDSKLILYLFISGLMVPAPFVYAVIEIGIGLALTIVYVGIVIGALLFSKFMAGEVLTFDKWLSVLFGFTGLFFVLGPTANEFGLKGAIAALISGLGVGLNMVINKKMPYSAIQTAIHSWLATAIVNLPFVFIYGEQFPSNFNSIKYVYLLLFSFASLCASFLVIKGLKLIDAGVASLLGLLEIVFGVMLGFVFYDERFTIAVITGICFICTAAAIPYVKHHFISKDL